jgi:hypothetical protein
VGEGILNVIFAAIEQFIYGIERVALCQGNSLLIVATVILLHPRDNNSFLAPFYREKL